MNVSVVIPTYNEASVIEACLTSLAHQTKNHELILIDDGSSDTTVEKIKNHEYGKTATFLKQSHKGPAAARNLGAGKASGEILVFVDADMTFDKNFITELTAPIEKKQTNGTFTKAEFVANWDNVWARCWNYKQGIATNRRIPINYPDEAPVFRALLATEFYKVHGYTEGIGWTDDWTLSRKLGYLSKATQAVCYHANPATLSEVFTQARWIGKNEFLTKNIFRIATNLVRFSFPISFVRAILTTFQYRLPHFVIFGLLYDFAISLSLFESLLGTDKNK